MEIALLFGLIILNGVFAMSEIALVTARKVRLSKLAEAGDKAAIAALQLGEDPNKVEENEKEEPEEDQDDKNKTPEGQEQES